MIGLFHHQQRYDRDLSVKYVPANVDESDSGNFLKVSDKLLFTDNRKYGLKLNLLLRAALSALHNF